MLLLNLALCVKIVGWQVLVDKDCPLWPWLLLLHKQILDLPLRPLVVPLHERVGLFHCARTTGSREEEETKVKFETRTMDFGYGSDVVGPAAEEGGRWQIRNGGVNQVVNWAQ